jgi:hypothetical protein
MNLHAWFALLLIGLLVLTVRSVLAAFAATALYLVFLL